jgi:hypothetical protein
MRSALASDATAQASTLNPVTRLIGEAAILEDRRRHRGRSPERGIFTDDAFGTPRAAGGDAPC